MILKTCQLRHKSGQDLRPINGGSPRYLESKRRQEQTQYLPPLPIVVMTHAFLSFV